MKQKLDPVRFEKQLLPWNQCTQYAFCPRLRAPEPAEQLAEQRAPNHRVLYATAARHAGAAAETPHPYANIIPTARRAQAHFFGLRYIYDGVSDHRLTRHLLASQWSKKGV